MSNTVKAGFIHAEAFYSNYNVIDKDIIISSPNNAMRIGPVTIADGVTVTIEEEGSLTII